MKHIFERNFLSILEKGKDMLIEARSISDEEAKLYLRIILYYNLNKITEENTDHLKQALDQTTEQKGERINPYKIVSKS